MAALHTRRRGGAGAVGTALLALFVSLSLSWRSAGAEPGGAPARIAIFVGEHAAHEEGAAAAQAYLHERGVEVVLIQLTDAPGRREQALSELKGFAPSLVLAAGSSATTAALEGLPSIPVVFMLVPSAADASFLAHGNPHLNRVAGVTTDVHPRDLLALIRELQSGRGSTIAVLHGAGGGRSLDALKREAAASEVKLVLIPTKKEQFADAVAELDRARCDGVLMLPDASVYNAAAVQRLLKWGLVEGRSVYAFSENVVRAGAVAGRYCSNTEVAEQAADLALRIVSGSEEPGGRVEHPKRVRTAVNRRSAELIGVSLSERTLPEGTLIVTEQP